MEKVAIGTNDLGMHIVIRPISKDLLSKDEIVGMETEKINSLLTARRPITFVDAISALPPLLPSSADPITGRRLYSVNEIMSGSCGIHFGPPVPELLRYETELSANTVLESSIASARSAAKRIPCNGQWLTDVLGNADPDSTSSYTKDDARVRLTVLQNRRPTWIETGLEAFTSSLKPSLQGRLQSFNRSNLTTQNDLHGRKQREQRLKRRSMSIGPPPRKLG